MRAAVLGAGLLCATAALAGAEGGDGAPAAEPQLPEIDVSYDVSWNGMHLGQASILLKREGETDCYRYESVTNPVGMVRMFYGRPREISLFCVRQGRVVPQRFVFESNDKDDSFKLDFDMAAGMVSGGHRNKPKPVPPNAQDRFGLQQAVRLWVLERLRTPNPGAATVEFAMVDHSRVKTYRFAITGRESVEVPAGTFDAVVVERVDDPNKSSRFWLARERDYMPVKVEQIKGGSADLRMVLRK
jgi:hypothetical protein